MNANAEASHSHSQERIFWPRTSEVVAQLAEVLATEPERPLTEEQKNQVIQFEKDLFHGKYGDIESVAPLAEIESAVDNTAQLVPEYLATEKGRSEIHDALGISLSETTDLGVIANEVRAIPVDVLKDSKNKEKLQSLQGSSLNYIESRYAAMAEGDESARDIDTITIIKDPQLFLARLSVLQQNRNFLRLVRAELRESDDDLTAAKHMVTDIYRDKVNSLVAGSYTTLIDVRSQYAASNTIFDESEVASVQNLFKVAAAAESSNDIRTQFVRLLDYVRNGAALDDEGSLTPVDSHIFEHVNELNEQPASKSNQPHFSEQEIEQLKEYIFDSSEMQAFLNMYLVRTGLSKEGWTTERRDDTKSFAVNAIHKIIKIPATYKSAVAKDFPTTGVIGLVEHEVGGKQAGHVMQSVSASKNPELFELAKSSKFRGKRYLAMREAGGTSAEADAMQRYFGQTRRFGTSYASAMKELLEGGTHADAVRAFAEAQIDGREVSPEESKKAYAIAANRVMRLLREGGRNSQPIQYVEAATVRKVAQTLPEPIVDVMFAEAVYDPVDMMRLHKFGLLGTDSDHRFKPDEDPETVVQELLRERISANS